MTESLSDLIRNVRFTPVRVREGYDMGQVDYFLDRLEAAAEAGQSLDPILDSAQFKEVRLREGYDIAEVEKFLADLRTWRAPEPDPEGWLDRAPDPGSISLPPIATEPTRDPGVITEQRGFLSRLFGRR